MDTQYTRSQWLAMRGTYGRTSHVTSAHITHRLENRFVESCEWCVKESKKSTRQLERQATRQNGKYSEYMTCDHCGKPMSVDATHHDDDNGTDALSCGTCVKVFSQQ